jgi:tRNA(fMet)-specific endonuclease VapC
VSYLLDTNVCIALINGSSDEIRRRYLRVAGRSRVLPSTSSIVAHELWYGVAKSGRVDQNARRLNTFLMSAVELLEYTERDAQAAGEIRAELEQQGQRIGEYDTLIAGQAFCRNLVLVTANSREFGRVKGLVVEDWTE